MTTPLEGPLADSEAGLWIPGTLARPGTVTGTVPAGFEAYARIFHPAHARLMEWDRGSPVPVQSRSMQWRELAEIRGTLAHPLMQWNAILAGYRNPVWNEPGWQYEDPLVGALAGGHLAEVVRILASHTSSPATCTAGLWEGWGWVSGATADVAAGKGDFEDPLPPPFHRGDVAGAAKLELPGRRYLLFNADLAVFADPGWHQANGWDMLQSPNLLWPEDRAWFLASEIDMDSTIVGGSALLIDELGQSGTVEALPVPPDGELGSMGDLLNDHPDWQ